MRLKREIGLFGVTAYVTGLILGANYGKYYTTLTA
jgi:hypothetical protein